MLGGGAYFEERNEKEGVPYDAPSMPEMKDVFGPSKQEKEKMEEEVSERKRERAREGEGGGGERGRGRGRGQLRAREEGREEG